jgi:protein SCO1
MKGLSALLPWLLLAAPLAAAPPAPAADSPAHRYFTDVVLVDQDGRERRLYTDLLQGKTVIISGMFTECSGVCPLMAATLEKVQAWAGDRLGKEVHLLSFSVDPANDTPAKLKAYAERFHARPGWYFLTGKREDLETALRKLGLWVEDREAHVNLMSIGNDRTGLWKKALGLAPASDIIQIVDGVHNDKG